MMAETEMGSATWVDNFCVKFYYNALWANIFLRITNKAPTMESIFSSFLKTPSSLLQRETARGAFEARVTWRFWVAFHQWAHEDFAAGEHRRTISPWLLSIPSHHWLEGFAGAGSEGWTWTLLSATFRHYLWEELFNLCLNPNIKAGCRQFFFNNTSSTENSVWHTLNFLITLLGWGNR